MINATLTLAQLTIVVSIENVAASVIHKQDNTEELQEFCIVGSSLD